MPLKLFSEEYHRVKDGLKNYEYGDVLKIQLSPMKSILGSEGPSESGANNLEEMRAVIASDESGKIMKSAGIDADKRPTPEAVDKAAIAKFLRHLYFISGRGSQKVWVFSSPEAYSDYPTEEFKSINSNVVRIKSSLHDTKERFSADMKKQLGEATLVALNWCMRTQMVLSSAATSEVSIYKIRRWFADESVSDGQLNTTIANLLAGFKKVVNTLNSTFLLYTDMASLRRAAAGSEDMGYFESEAFVYAGRYEKLPIIYIENAFFGTSANVLSGPKNWSRIIVHELTHLDCSTKDEKYGWAGIAPGKSISVEQAARNADSWAYFVLK